ncbi:PREDICTED: tubulin--tyrosine ligase-like protein 12 isoform X2 [Priapulus caudatus]|nr:PREDICTED: tubulin--tyrosine ligase-like protein 12 isoform X2 [Priapulus caudatus]
MSNHENSVVENELSVFISLHRPQLESAGIPQIYWSTLMLKLKNEVLDAGSAFSLLEVQDEEGTHIHWKVVVTIDEGINVGDHQHIYLVDHAWTYTVRDARQHLQQIPGLLERMAALFDIDADSLTHDELVEITLNEMWRYNQTYRLGNIDASAEEKLPVWYILDEFGSRIMHSSDPSFRAVPFFNIPSQMSFTVIWPMKDLNHGDEVTRSYVENESDDQIRAVRMLPWEPSDFTYIDSKQLEPPESFFAASRENETLPCEDRLDKFSAVPPSDSKYKVFSNYSYVNDFLNHPRFEIVHNKDEADILWVREHFKDYKTFSEESPTKFINQFPYESVLTIKDLLAIVCRRVARACEAGTDTDMLETRPAWLPTTYNLVTELPQFISYFQQREAKGLDNHWICKPWNLARGLDMYITNNINCLVRLPDTGPKIACKYIEDPVLFVREDVGPVKFDMRFIVLLSCVRPMKVCIYQHFWLRFANKAFSLDALDDYEKHFTVMNYRDDGDWKQMYCDEFASQFEQQYPIQQWSNVMADILSVIKSAIECAMMAAPPAGIAHSPQSRAMYGVDMMLAWKKNARGDKYIQPMLCEFNYTPDCARACTYYSNFFNDVFSTLFLDDITGRPVIQL